MKVQIGSLYVTYKVGCKKFFFYDHLAVKSSVAAVFDTEVSWPSGMDPGPFVSPFSLSFLLGPLGSDAI